jgi:hypothetical protein
VRGGSGVEAGGGGRLSGGPPAAARRGSPPAGTWRASSSPPPSAAPACAARHGTRRRGAGVSSLSYGGPLWLCSPAATRASSPSLRPLLSPPPPPFSAPLLRLIERRSQPALRHGQLSGQSVSQLGDASTQLGGVASSRPSSIWLPPWS